MENTPPIESLLNDWILPHWPFFCAMLVFAMIGQVMKSIVTKDMADSNTLARLFRETLPLHPVATGFVLGYSKFLPTSGGVESQGASALYFAAAGVLSSWTFHTVKRYLQKRGFSIPSELPFLPPEVEDDDSDGKDSGAKPSVETPETDKAEDPDPDESSSDEDSDSEETEDPKVDVDSPGDSKPPSDKS